MHPLRNTGRALFWICAWTLGCSQTVAAPGDAGITADGSTHLDGGTVTVNLDGGSNTDGPAQTFPGLDVPGPTPTSDGAVSVMVFADAGPSDGSSTMVSPTASLFAHCAQDADCGPGSTCDLTYPAGQCTRQCTSSADCEGAVAGLNGVCALYTSGEGGRCRPQCTLGGHECVALNEACLQYNNPLVGEVSLRAYYPACGPLAAACVSGETCDLYTGLCDVTVLDLGAENGAPCTENADCKSGRCDQSTQILATGMTVPTGYLGGACYSISDYAPSSAYAMGATLPQGDCPTGSVAAPLTGSYQEYGYTHCLPSCHADTDCRAGYLCDAGQSAGSPPYFGDGFCTPINCMDGVHTCPTGSSCVTVTANGPTYYVCGAS